MSCLQFEYEKTRLASLYQYQVLDTDPEAAFDDLTRLASQICDTPIALISLVDADRQWFKSRLGLTVTETARDLAFCSYTILEDRPLIVEDALFDQRFSNNALVTHEPHIRFYAGAPLIVPSGSRIGTICVIDQVPRKLTTEQISALQALSRQVVNQLEMRRNLITLQERQNHLQTIINAEPECVKLIDKDGILLEMNPAGLTLIEADDASLVIGKSVYPLISPEYREMFQQLNQRVCQGEHGSLEFEIVGCRGTHRWMETHAVPLWNQTEKKYFQLSITRDITKSKQAEQALKHSLKDLADIKLAIDQFAVLAVIDARGRITDVNDKFCEISQYSRTELLQQNQQIIRCNHHSKVFFQQIWNTITNDQVWRGEIKNFAKDGTYYWLDATIVPCLDEQGRPYQYVAICNDITDRKQAEAALQASEEQLRCLLQNMPIMLDAFDSDGNITVWNQECERITGYSQSEIVNNPNAVALLYQDAAYRQRMLTDWEKYGNHYRNWEWNLTCKNGEVKTIAWSNVSDQFPVPGWAAWRIGVDITEHKQALERAENLAFYDQLTKLPNRALFLEYIRHNIQQPDNLFAILVIDLHNYQNVKYGLGFAKAEQFLQEVAKRLKTWIKLTDKIARVREDVFAILLTHLLDLNTIETEVQRFYEVLKLPFKIGGSSIYSSASIGVADSRIRCSKPEDFLEAADLALHSAKKQHKHTAFFNISMQAEEIERLYLETDLQQAIVAQQFHLCYQPIISLSTGALSGFEALIRWQHPKRGWISPVEFIPLAEQTGLIIPLGKWVLTEACRQMSHWQQHFVAPPMSITVNLSGVQLTQPDLVETIKQLHQAFDLGRIQLKLEITESVLMQNAESASTILNQFKENNIQICIDDFGTGYSSLAYLHRLPIDILKIDRSFVSQMTESTKNFHIVKTITSLAQSLDLNVVAEGIETKSQADLLRSLSCQYGQGYLFSKPLPADAVITWMQANHYINNYNQQFRSGTNLRE